jgi:hypothetical protein
MGTPFKMKGSPLQRNFGLGSPVRQTDNSDKDKDPVPTASDTLGAYAYQNYYTQYDDKFKVNNDKLKGHKVTEEEMLKSSESYLKDPKNKKK